MKTRWLWYLLVAMLWLTGQRGHAEAIRWYSEANKTNLTSGGGEMTSGFQFELGVFVPGFTPTMDNRTLWMANWRPANSHPSSPSLVAYVESTQQFESQYTVASNASPFTVGAAGYVWGVKDGVSSSEWILFRHEDWTWPASDGINPSPAEWNVAGATAIIGSINGNGYLMKSASVTSWAQWRSLKLEGVSENEPNQDPDKDGVSNLMEFVFDTSPKTAGAPPQTPVALVEVVGLKYLQITIPRRIDHPAILTVEVSSDLTTWQSGNAHTEVVSDTVTSLVVRDKTPFLAPVNRRFIRLRAAISSP